MRTSTTRFDMRPLRVSDRASYCNVLADPKVSGSLKLPVSPSSRAELSRMFEERRVECISGVSSRLAITLKRNGLFIGSIGSYPIDQERIGLSIWLSSEYHGQGFGTEALRGYCLPALESHGVQFIFANIASSNMASLSVARASGFSISKFVNDPGFGTVEGRVLLDIDRTRAKESRRLAISEE